MKCAGRPHATRTQNVNKHHFNKAECALQQQHTHLCDRHSTVTSMLAYLYVRGQSTSMLNVSFFPTLLSLQTHFRDYCLLPLMV